MKNVNMYYVLIFISGWLNSRACLLTLVCDSPEHGNAILVHRCSVSLALILERCTPGWASDRDKIKQHERNRTDVISMVSVHGRIVYELNFIYSNFELILICEILFSHCEIDSNSGNSSIKNRMDVEDSRSQSFSFVEIYRKTYKICIRVKVDDLAGVRSIARYVRLPNLY